MKQKETILVVILLVLGLSFRLFISQNPGFAVDVFTHKFWAESLYYKGLSHFYINTRGNLPPVFMYILYLISYPMMKFPKHGFLFLKLPGSIADICISLTIYIASKRKLGNKDLLKNAPLISMAVFLFNPAIIFDSAFWGKWDDPLLAFFLLLTIYNYGSYKEGVFYALAIFSKLQGIILAPILFRRRGLPKATISFLIASLVILLPFLPEIVTLYRRVFVKSFNSFPHITINAYNFWWLFNRPGWTKEWYDSPLDMNIYFFVVPKYFGILIYLLVSVLLNIYVRKYRFSFRSLCFASFFIYLTFFIFFTRMHERYMFWAIPFLALLVPLADERKYLYLYIILSLTYFLNMFVVYERVYGSLFHNPSLVTVLTVAIAVINVFTYAYLLSYLIRDIYHSKWERTSCKLLGFTFPKLVVSE
ncbi:MAG: hypothetical protein ACHQ6U_01190 [Thermodesulfobacteriota bacterium]